MTPQIKKIFFGSLFLLIVLATGLFVFLLQRLSPDRQKQTRIAGTNSLSTNSVAIRAVVNSNLATVLPFQKQPFVATRETSAFGWTTEDGKDPGVIRKLAHSELEAQRLTEENARIIRRQLVYHKDTAAAQIERAKLSGEEIQSLTLPGLDGREVQFVINYRDTNPSGLQGAFSGTIAGQTNSLVTFAFKGGREAFTILSPTDNLYLVGEPREPGQLIVKSIDPAIYASGYCGNQ